MRKYNIAQVGSFDVENYGDLLFQRVFQDKIGEHLNISHITLFAPKTCRMAFNQNIQVFSVTELEQKHLKNPFDAIVIGGGDLIHMVKIFAEMPAIADEPVIYEALYMWTIPAFVASKYNIPLIWNCPGVPMEFFNIEKNIIKALVNSVDYISVRDNPSKENLLKCGIIKEITVCPDIVLCLSDLITKDSLKAVILKLDLDFNIKTDYIVFQCNVAFSAEDLRVCADTLHKIKQKYGFKIVLMPIGYALGDAGSISTISSYYPDNFFVVEKKLNPMEMMSVISHAKCYIGSSLHGCITAVSYGIPEIVCNYTGFNKITGFFELIGHEKYLVNKPSDIYSVFRLGLERNFSAISKLKQEIDRHFVRMAEAMEQKKNDKTITHLAKEMVEYINITRNMSAEADKTRNELNILRIEQQNNLKHIESLIEQLFSYENIVKEMENSTSWKITKPFRKISDIIKHRG